MINFEISLNIMKLKMRTDNPVNRTFCLMGFAGILTLGCEPENQLSVHIYKAQLPFFSDQQFLKIHCDQSSCESSIREQCNT